MISCSALGHDTGSPIRIAVASVRGSGILPWFLVKAAAVAVPEAVEDVSAAVAVPDVSFKI